MTPKDQGKDSRAYYRAQAEECRRAAQEASVREVRQTYLERAAKWEELARQAELN